MKNQLKTLALFGTLTAIVVGFGGLIAPGYLYLFAALSLPAEANNEFRIVVTI